MDNNTVRVDYKVLEQFGKELFMTSGMSEEDAKFHSEALVDTDLRGGSSHGVMRLPAYFNRMLNGAINTKPNIKTIKGSLGLEVMDGDDGAGFIVGRDAMNRAIELAEEYNIGAVGVINSNHFGASGLYARMAAEKGMVGLVMTNVKPAIIAPGASKPVAGNNPFAAAIPTYGEFPFALDLAFSKVAGGKITVAMKKGEKIPIDWATDSDGKPTDDATKAFNGYLKPMADFKGLGLSYMMDILSGVITGGTFSQNVKSMYKSPEDPSLTSHFMIVIKISAIISEEEMKERMQEYLKMLKDTPMWDGTEMYLPGERAYLKTQERKKNGVPLAKKTLEELNELAKKMNVATKLVVME